MYVWIILRGICRNRSQRWDLWNNYILKLLTSFICLIVEATASHAICKPPSENPFASLYFPRFLLPQRNQTLYWPIFPSMNYAIIIIIIITIIIIFHGARAHSGPGPPHYRGFTIILRHNTLDRTPLYEWSARRRDLYLTTFTRKSMPPAGFEPAIPASERPQTHALHRAATWLG